MASKNKATTAKTKPIEKKRTSSKKDISTSEYLNLVDIRGDFLYTTDNKIFQFIKVLPISTALMTETEKSQLTKKMTRELSPTKVPFKILFLTRPTDVRQIVDYYENIKSTTTDQRKRENLTKTIRYFSQMALSGGVLERQTFIALWTQNEKQTEDDLIIKTLDFRNALISTGVTATICDETDIVNMLGLYYNPTFSVNTAVDTTPRYSFLEGANEN